MASRNDNDLARIISEAVTTALRQSRSGERDVAASTSTSTPNNEQQVCIVYCICKSANMNYSCYKLINNMQICMIIHHVLISHTTCVLFGTCYVSMVDKYIKRRIDKIHY